MRVIESKSNFVFTVQDITNAEQHKVHTRRTISYAVTQHDAQASDELLDQTAHFDDKYHLLESITGVRRRKETYEVIIRRAEYETTNKDTWEPVDQIRKDMPGVMEEYLHAAGEQNLKKK